MTREVEQEAVRAGDELLRWSRAIVDPVLRNAVGRFPRALEDVAQYHFGWCDEDGAPRVAPGGKAIRPAFALLAAEAVGGDAAAAAPAAAAVELVHNFSLLHDDVMDGDATRRHRPTAWTVFGTNAAILTGDALLIAASDMLSSSGHPGALDAVRLLGAGMLELLEGQSADLAFERRDDVTPAECLAMVEGKTAALLGAACALGGLFGGADTHHRTALREFGRLVGIAFQHVDDMLGIWGDPAVTGKPVHADLRAGKKSLPVVAALNSATTAGDELAALYRRRPLSGDELVRAADLVEAAGGREWSRTQADALLERAVERLHSAALNPRALTELAVLARLATRRDH
ncbi:geranylgeranyl diphosphate synthase type I [Prauserella shujinwangii]|uniref:Geranylgeranyl diphosphate synthase type I n=1 Tax=Prauserella shujinwangii TaxID=1453103 RepID=A0A2T0LNV5_9PSEU|nr:family 2 encapsulin nanocompartment cargo protein polyprenyl transferase [Prauserella shujinwangii]PRX44915.1 geranylgeranyl diphosphate synthase type I [Prauserella shujinwangii]